MPPVNDNRANATVLDASPGWGVVEGTTIGATEESGEPYAPAQQQSVWYSIPDMAAGLFVLHIRADTEAYFEVSAWGSTPANAQGGFEFVTAYDELYLGEHFSDDDIYRDHTGGPIAIRVLSYSNYTSPGDFTLGWGSGHDTNPAHYGAYATRTWQRQYDDNSAAPSTTRVFVGQNARIGADETRSTRTGRWTSNYGTDYTVVDPAQDACIYENARWGQVGESNPCSGFNGLGRGTDQENRVGNRSAGQGTGWGTGTPGRAVHMYVGIAFNQFNIGDLTERSVTTPAGFDPALHWAPVYDDGTRTKYNEIQNAHAEFSVSNPLPLSSNHYQDPAAFTVECRAVRPVDRAVGPGDPNDRAAGLAIDQWRQITTSSSTGPEATVWQTPTRTDQPLLANFTATPGTTEILDVPDPWPLINRDDNNNSSPPSGRPLYLRFYFISSHTRTGHVPPPAPQQTQYKDSTADIWRTAATRRFDPVAGTAYCEWRPSPWRPYLRWSLDERPAAGGWKVNMINVGG